MQTLPRTRLSNTKISSYKKALHQPPIEPISDLGRRPYSLQIRQKARKKGLSISETLRKLLIKALKDEESVDEALDTESLRESLARENRRLGRRLSWLLIWLIFDVGHIKVHTTNLLGMQKGMKEEMLKDILRDADRQTKTRLSRKNPELTEFVDAIEKWLVAAEEDGSRERGRDKRKEREGRPRRVIVKANYCKRGQRCPRTRQSQCPLHYPPPRPGGAQSDPRPLRL